MAYETSFSPDHSDRVTVLQLNHDSSKLLTASIDHRVVIYEIDASTGQRKQLDVFTAHDAEIRDAKWFHPSTGTHFVTIGNDLQMRIWTQETSQAPMLGRRFRKIATIKCEQLVPFVSVDVKTIGSHTYLTVIDRQGLLSLYEPTNPDEFKEWSLIDQFYVCHPIPGRSDHTSFRVQFDPNPFPLPYLTSFSDDRAQLSVAVAALNHIKLYRSVSDPDIINAHKSPPSPSSTNVGRSATHNLYLFEVLKIPAPNMQPPTSAGSLLRDIAYSPNNIRGTDVLAVASINGTVAIYDVSLQSKSFSDANAGSSRSPNVPNKQTTSTTRPSAQTHQSNLTSALHAPSAATTNGSSGTTQQTTTLSRSAHPFSYTHHATPISTFKDAHNDAWSVQWDPSGQILLSSGNDGTVKMWKRVVGGSAGVTGEFELFAEQGEEDESDDEVGEEARREDDGV
ncbi:hypothetical protein H2198_005995 [Neophaeococcomyces mojaviensis]|uniref:Uncharacterized protein n=1 Tax=Neophaeococcomyces mojaviensis TaxID=3383035 RepID=A0ACC3A491_9EURO|nr:hypothetical protein H2198_005995 [Knufia sp. JES_112]